MPTVLQSDGFHVRILLPPREHGPPHVHVSRAGAEVVNLLPVDGQALEIRTVYRMRRAEVIAAVRYWWKPMYRCSRERGGRTMADRALTDAEILRQIPQARAQERAARKLGHRARTVRFDRSHARVVVELSSGVLFAFPVRAIPALRRATPAELAKGTVAASGSALRWEALDVDLSVAGLLLSAVDPGERVRHLATLAGRATSDAKAAAARVNGAKGGRPRKVPGSTPKSTRRTIAV